MNIMKFYSGIKNNTCKCMELEKKYAEQGSEPGPERQKEPVCALPQVLASNFLICVFNLEHF